ncbi:protein singed wings 2 [Tribolium castaneum]|uniref:Protein singed wings 2-like Protein n=1 Tax=Tribolium castaneum TaxID=7070 RepID=D6WW75_TRICA|nr:PREDICTED: protein singed wings 2 [Tribolium castaneum]EFA09304.2 Protein singed wings 2-like Protein [Tribolium castaneum]|eukprot:XP_001812636.1 PREDICTED: protein singed wings 2 [Tribolium castaneum]
MLTVFWLILLHLLAPIKCQDCILKTPHHLTCVTHLPHLENEFPPNITILELRDIEQDELDLNYMIHKYPQIENVSIYDGNIVRLKSPNPANKIKVLRLVRIGVENIGNKFLANFPNLEILDLRENFLQSLGNFSVGKLKELYLDGNTWNCSQDLNWVLKLNQTIVKDLNNLTCQGNPHPNKNLVTIARFTKDLKNNCPSICSCTLPKVVFTKMGSQRLEPLIEVNCSHRGLTHLPLDLPAKSRIIHLEGNEIEDLKPLKHHQIYRKVLDLYLDNNKVKTIEELEGSYFLKHFRVFSLSGNKLTEVPTYALDNALTQNPHMPNALTISLGGNPWRCDCVFTPVFQEMLQKFAPQIHDLREVKCSYVEGDENSLLPIIELSRSSVCRSPSEYSVQALDLLNGVLASLILLILGKLAYDYYYFKKTGRLPWIVTKMP